VYERAKPILQSLPEVDELKKHPGTLTGSIEISNLSFRYGAEDPLILHDITIDIKPGEFVAIVGSSGSGKSTLLRLLLGFEKPSAGMIRYDGQDLASLDMQALRRQIGVVLQDGSVLGGSIYENIVGSSPLTLDDAWAAATLAGLEEDIRTMPMQMHTVITAGGGTLSGGQYQRVLIARALVAQTAHSVFR
jgi:ABC-type bacteriocin/lantibiotic exporter with double-glycine peptidase domain